MGETTTRYGWVWKPARVIMAATLLVLALALVGSIAMCVLAAGSAGFWGCLPYILSSLALIIAGGWVFVAYGLIRVIVSNEQAVTRISGHIGRLETLLSDQGESLKQLVDLTSLSDQAKSLIYRDRELDALRETIHTHLMKQEYEDAEKFISELERKLGMPDEAARLRQELEATRKATQEEKIDRAVRRVEEIIAARDWARAAREAERLHEQYPESDKVARLPQRIQAEQVRHKRELLHAYDRAVRKNDIDRSIELLRELDLYLTPQEAAAMEESARGVFRAKLHNLGVQFAICVTEERWSDAVETGEQIMNEFPNSRMAHEVGEKMDMLRTRAQAVETR
ncbi:MAG: hypothetical protein ACP5HU_09650 [Phycisphaerae bacterium]